MRNKKDFPVWMKLMDELLRTDRNLLQICKNLNHLTYTHGHKLINEFKRDGWLISKKRDLSNKRINIYELTSKGKGIALVCNDLINKVKNE